MARAKNRGYQQSFSPSYTIRRWRLGIYIRLSKEDLKKGKDDSNSVKNQRDLLNDFYRRNIDEFESITEYVDDGHTGTDANREDFQRLLADVMSGKINCVIVKDLSRFARNYSDAGSLIDNLFVQMGVRFISLAENVDSYKNPDSVSNIIVPITNVMNDNYCYQTSKKIRQVFDYKRRNGQYIGAFAPYGYVKHPKDKHRLIVDPDAAENVKLIFTMLIQGSSKRAIALYLNEHGVPSASMKNKIKSLFNLMLDYALEYELVDRNYSRTFNLTEETIKEIVTVKKEHIPFTQEEMDLLWQHVDDKMYVDVILIQCYSGWRPQEIGLLELKDVDLENGTFSGGMKTDAGTNRVVPIHSKIRHLVERHYKEAQKMGSVYLFNYANPSSRVKNTALTYNRYQKAFGMIRDELKLNPEHRPHDGRKHFVTMAKKYGVDEYAIKYMVGHKISDITEKVYTQREFEWLKDEIEKIK